MQNLLLFYQGLHFDFSLFVYKCFKLLLFSHSLCNVLEIRNAGKICLKLLKTCSYSYQHVAIVVSCFRSSSSIDKHRVNVVTVFRSQLCSKSFILSFTANNNMSDRLVNTVCCRNTPPVSQFCLLFRSKRCRTPIPVGL